MCSAECTLCPNTADGKNSKYYALADITLLRFDVCVHLRIRIHAARATGTREIESERYRDRDVELFCSTPRVTCASSRRDRELKYSSQPIVKNQATMNPKAWISTGDSSLCGHLRRSSL